MKLWFHIFIFKVFYFSQSGLTLSALAVSDNGNFVATGSMSEVSKYLSMFVCLYVCLSVCRFILAVTDNGNRIYDKCLSVCLYRQVWLSISLYWLYQTMVILLEQVLCQKKENICLSVTCLSVICLSLCLFMCRFL